MTSKDGEATYLVVGLRVRGRVPGLRRGREVAALGRRGARAPPGTEVHVTGDPAMISDLTTAVNEASLKITAVSLLLLVGILWLVYRRRRRPCSCPLVTIGVALLCTRGALAWPVSTGWPCRPTPTRSSWPSPWAPGPTTASS